VLNRSIPPSDESQGSTALSGVLPVASTAESVRQMLVSALTELLQTYEVEPRGSTYLANGEQASQQMLAKISFENEAGEKGTLLLGVPLEIIDAMQLGTRSVSHADWLGELANQYLGRFKNKLLAYGLQLNMGTPFVSTAPVLPAKEIGNAAEWLCVDTDFGSALAAAEGLPSDDALGKQTTQGFLSEGDLQLF
jgi:hypothetical protein